VVVELSVGRPSIISANSSLIGRNSSSNSWFVHSCRQASETKTRDIVLMQFARVLSSSHSFSPMSSRDDSTDTLIDVQPVKPRLTPNVFGTGFIVSIVFDILKRTTQVQYISVLSGTSSREDIREHNDIIWCRYFHARRHERTSKNIMILSGACRYFRGTPSRERGHQRT
jgi:hypothetical protein